MDTCIHAMYTILADTMPMTTLLKTTMLAIVYATCLQRQSRAWITLWNGSAAAHLHTLTVTDILLHICLNTDTPHVLIMTIAAMDFLPSRAEATITTIKPIGEDMTETPDGPIRDHAARTITMIPIRTPGQESILAMHPLLLDQVYFLNSPTSSSI